MYEIDEAGSEPPADAPRSEPKPWFADVSDRLNHQHHEDAFDDFTRQPLLPHRLSQLGPGIAWHDFDGDGWDDLIVGTGRGGSLGIQRNTGDGRFAPISDPALQRPTGRDLTTVLGIGPTLFVGASNYEDGRTNGGCLRIYDVARKASGDSVLGESSSAGPLALADFDGDDALDLFIGGRVVPGHYPEAATSLLLRNEGGRFVARQRLKQFGLASGAVFSDLDNDGDSDLAVAVEWGSIRLLRNDTGQFSDWNPPIKWQRAPADAPATLGALVGWWTSVTTGDFDGDGRQDLVLGNWGTNHKFQRDLSYRRPRVLYYGDLDESGTVDLIETVFSPESSVEVPERGYLAALEAMPFIRETIETFEAYGTNSLAGIYGDRLQRAAKVQVNTLTSVLLLNRGEHFEVRPLPAEAQFSPAFGLCVGDLDGDGAEDLFVAQNFFATTVEYTRYDAGRSVLLKGDGKGDFTVVPGQESGLRIYGEQRGAAVADFDRDGRLDLAVTQNANATKLYRNLAARPGLRVRLQGAAGNPAAIGAVLRLRFGDRLGPAREIHAGAGYWSQDSSSATLATPLVPTALEIRWPGGRATTTPLMADARSVTVDLQGKIIGQ